jgi:hypothetical protein
MADDFDIPDGPISLQTSMLLAKEINGAGVSFVPPLAYLLARMNDPKVSAVERDFCARTALPYCHATPQQNPMVVLPDMETCETASEIVAAQSKIMGLMTSGRLSPQVGKTYIESLALMARTLEVAQGPGATTLRVVGGLPELQVDDVAPAPDNVTPFPKDAEQSADVSPSRSTG